MALGYPWRLGEVKRTRFGFYRVAIIDLAGITHWWGPRSRTVRGAQRRAISDANRARRQGTL